MSGAPRLPIPVAALVTTVLVACGGDVGPAGDIEAHVTDSAGVRIVAYAGAPQVEAPFAIAEEPVYRHGAHPGDYEFQFINVGRLFPDGGPVVADRENSEVLVLSPDGTALVLGVLGVSPLRPSDPVDSRRTPRAA